MDIGRSEALNKMKNHRRSKLARIKNTSHLTRSPMKSLTLSPCHIRSESTPTDMFIWNVVRHIELDFLASFPLAVI